jgi:hypothetical protein
LEFGNDFNQPLLNSVSNQTNLTHLSLGYDYYSKEDLPFNIKFLTLNCNNQFLIDNLPNSIEELELGFYFDLEFENLPNSIKKISFDKTSKYYKPLNNLPYGLELLKLPVKYNKKIKLPSGIKKIICSKDYEFINDLIESDIKLETY